MTWTVSYKLINKNQIGKFFLWTVFLIFLTLVAYSYLLVFWGSWKNPSQLSHFPQIFECGYFLTSILAYFTFKAFKQISYIKTEWILWNRDQSNLHGSAIYGCPEPEIDSWYESKSRSINPCISCIFHRFKYNIW